MQLQHPSAGLLDLTPNPEAIKLQNVPKECQLSVCRFFPSSCHRFVHSFTFRDRIARFPAPHWMPLVPAALQFPLRFNFSSGVAEDFDRLVQLLDIERLFQNGNWTDLQNSVQHLAVGVAGDHDHI